MGEMAGRLSTYRHELSLRMLALLNENAQMNSTDQKDGFRSLEGKGDDIIDVVSINQKLTADGTAQNLLLHEKTQKQLDRVTAAIFARGGGRTTTGSPRAGSGEPELAQRSGTTDGGLLQNFMAVYGSDELNIQGAVPCFSMRDFPQNQRRVLDALSFRKIRDREYEVALAHRSTLEWVFEDPEPLQKPWANFMQWLESGEACYWINGKPGSGKSTLMKHIYKDRRTHDALSVWAGKRSLIVASFFFYNLGSTLQKSQAGLLRSLLCDILNQNPELLPSLVPTLCVAALKGEDLEPSYTELKRAFENLVRIFSSSASCRMCLFIDGIDEFEGDHFILSDFFASVAASPNIKLVVSSRPIPACVDVFANSPGLRLQDLTFNDIKSYTNDIVGGNKRWREIAREENARARQLIGEIVEKSSGVFLWVVLVVASLLDGLRNYDRVADLRQRLEDLPADVEKLYNHMLGKLEPRYQRQASQLLQIVYQHVDIEDDSFLSTLQLSFAEEEDPEYAIISEVESLSIAKKISRCKATEGRVRSRCCGLIEIWHDWDLSEEERITHSRVNFLHRTAVEFLRNSDVWSHIASFTKSSPFDPNVALASAFLFDIKTSFSGDSYFHVICPLMTRCVIFCRLAECTTSLPQTKIVDELDRVMTLQWDAIRKFPFVDISRFIGRATHSYSDGYMARTWTLWELQKCFDPPMPKYFENSQSSMFVLAATAGLALYIREKYHKAGAATDSLQAQHALAVAVAVFSLSQIIFFRWSRAYDLAEPLADIEILKAPQCQGHSDVIRHLLSLGADPNQRTSLCRFSPWMAALERTRMIVDEKNELRSEGDIMEWIQVLKLFLDHSANPNENIESLRRYDVQESASSIIMKLQRFCSSSAPEVTESLRQLVSLLDKRKKSHRNPKENMTWS